LPAIEVRAFGKLYFLFKDRGWSNPLVITDFPPTVDRLIANLRIPEADVEVVFVNRVIRPLTTRLQDGDRVAFVPPGIPSIHRFNLGFYAAKEDSAG